MAEGVCGGAKAGAAGQRGGAACEEELILAIDSGVKAEGRERHTACTDEYQRCAPAESDEAEGQVMISCSAIGLEELNLVPV